MVNLSELNNKIDEYIVLFGTEQSFDNELTLNANKELVKILEYLKKYFNAYSIQTGYESLTRTINNYKRDLNSSNFQRLITAEVVVEVLTELRDKFCSDMES